MDPSHESIEERLRHATEECARVQAENLHLRELLLTHGIEILPTAARFEVKSPAAEAGIAKASPPAQKLALFRSLFRGREDVYAARWEAKDGRSGYSPACLMDWHAIRAAPPEERKKIARQTRALLPLTDEAIRDHLIGKQTIGLYPLLPDETCWLLAVDFDKTALRRKL